MDPLTVVVVDKRKLRADLVKQCKEKGLPITGGVEELQARLQGTPIASESPNSSPVTEGGQEVSPDTAPVQIDGKAKRKVSLRHVGAHVFDSNSDDHAIELFKAHTSVIRSDYPFEVEVIEEGE